MISSMPSTPLKASGKKISTLNNASSYNLLNHLEEKIIKQLPDVEKIKKLQNKTNKKYPAGVMSKDNIMTLEATNYGLKK